MRDTGTEPCRWERLLVCRECSPFGFCQAQATTSAMMRKRLRLGLFGFRCLGGEIMNVALRRALQLPSCCAMGIVPFRMARAIGRGYDGFGSECQRGRWRSKRRQLLQTAVVRLHAIGGYQHVRIFCLAWGTRNFQTYFNADKNGYWMAVGGNNEKHHVRTEIGRGRERYNLFRRHSAWRLSSMRLES